MRSFPAGYVSKIDEDHDDRGPGWGWGTKLLSYIEQESVLNRINMNLPIEDSLMESVRKTSTPVFNCPSDSRFTTWIDVPSKDGNRVICTLSAANYVASAGTIRTTCKYCRDRFDGVFGRNREIKPAELLDGLSNTLALVERSAKWSHATLWGVVTGSRLNDNQQQGKYAAGPAYVLGTTFKDGFNIEELPLEPGEENTNAEAFGSLHPGGANFAFCDGSVRFVFDSVDPRVMNALATRDGITKGGLADPVIHDSPF